MGHRIIMLFFVIVVYKYILLHFYLHDGPPLLRGSVTVVKCGVFVSLRQCVLVLCQVRVYVEYVMYLYLISIVLAQFFTMLFFVG